MNNICVHDLDTINEFIKLLLDTPFNKSNANENLYLSLKDKINTFLIRNKHIDKNDIRTIIKLYHYSETGSDNPSLPNAISILALMLSLITLGLYMQNELSISIPSIFYSIISFIGFLVAFDIAYIEYCRHLHKTKYKILYTCSLILEDSKEN